MRTKTVSGLLKTTLYLLFMLLSASGAYAQTDITIGSATGSNGNFDYPCPIQDYYEGHRAQYLYKASELIAKGMQPGFINAVKFNAITLNDADLADQFAIKIVGTTVASLSDASWEPVGNNAFGPVDYTPVLGLNVFTLTPGFFWNGTDNILIEVCGGADDWSGNPSFPYTSGLSFNGSHTFRQDAGFSLCGTTQVSNTGDMTTRPDIIFNWTPALACTGTPVGGTTVSNVSAVCLNESFTLSLTGNTVASGLTYQWQSSPNNTTWTNIPGATTGVLTTTQTASTYYRCVVTCTASAASANSSSAQITSPTLISGTFTINKALPTGSGNFASFNDAYNYIKCGINGPVVFNVVTGSGPYNEQLNMIPVPGASATNTVTFNGNANTLSFLSTNGNEREVIKLNGADYIIFNGLVINALGTSTAEYGFAVQLLNDADFNTINNCTIICNTTSTSTNYAGIVVSPSANSATNSGTGKCDNNTFSNNTIIGGYYGITLVGNTTDAPNGGNKIINNKISDYYNYGIYILGSFNTTIEKNTFSRPTRASVADFYGIYMTGLSTKVVINANRFTDPFGGALASTSTFYGIYTSSVDAIPGLENVISNNLMYNLSGSGSIYAIYNSSSDNIWYYHNTLSLDGTASPGTSYSTRGFYQTLDAGGVNFIDNIITITRGGQNAKHCLYFNTASSQITSNYNDLFISPAAANAFTGYYTTNQATLANWKANALQDANSISGNPIYKDITLGDYSPTSAAINDRGTPIGILEDINSAARSTATPDMGAYEFTPPVCTSPPTAGSATVNITPVCIDMPVSLNLAGNSIGLTQTYQWQYSTTATGTYTNLGAPINYPDTSIRSIGTLYYRAAVTCGTNTTYSDPVLLTVNPALPGGTYTIDKTAPASAVNFVSFNAAKAAMACGISGPVIFNVVPGRTTYEEQLVLDSIRGVSAINTITFLGNGNTIHFTSSNTDERAVIKLRQADHTTFDSLTIDATGTGTYGYGVQLVNYADSNTIRKCNIITNNTSTSSLYAGIVINAVNNDATTTGKTRCTGNIFSNNTVTGGYYGVTLVGGNSDPVIGNRFISNAIQESYSYGFYLNNTYNTLLSGNLITRPTRTSSSFSYYAIYASSDNGLLNITENRITNPYGAMLSTTNSFYGIYFNFTNAPTGATNVISNNIFYNITGQGSATALYNAGSANAAYYHNTILMDNTGGSSSYTTRGFYQTSATSELKFINNIVVITASGTNAKHAIYLSDPTTEIVADNNDYYVKGGGSNNFIGYNGTGYITLTDWQITTAMDAASVSTDPVFADVANGNLAPVVFSIDNIGQPVGITTDILHKTRSATKPDIGAYEIDIQLCTTPLNAGTAVVTPNTGICVGTPIVLDLTGNTPGGRLTYQWQAAISANGPWINITDTMYVSRYKTELGMTNFYRCRIVCSGTDTAYSTVTSVSMNTPLMKGLYTIDPAGSGSRNFTSFVAAVAAMECGIAGEVIFEAVPGTYTEQVRMHKIGGASDTSRVTFRSQNGNPASVTLTYAPTAANNYVLKLDSASFVTYKNLTIAATGTTNARVVELTGVTAYDSLLYNKINMPATTTNSTNIAGVYANAFNGKKNTIIGNTFTNGASGIWFSGPSNTMLAPGLVIDSNTVNGAYVNGIYVLNAANAVITRNTINRTTAGSTPNYGIYASYCDTAYRISQNKVNISNSNSSTYGIYVDNSNGTQGISGSIVANKVLALTGNTGILYGLYITSCSNHKTVNNVVSIATSAASSYALYSIGNSNANYFNNSIHSTATSTTNNVAGYFSNTSAATSNIKIRNNIFSHAGGGYALLAANPLYLNSDYNTFYTSGTNLFRSTSAAANYATLADWRTATDLDLSSIVYKPAFVSNANLEPDVNNADVWAIHGRGVQVTGNDRDFNDQYRPVTLAEGVPDMGAYEFLPAVEPPLLQPIPLAPAAGTTQRIMFGTDTVAKITWSPATAVPTGITLKRYSGIKPPKLAAGREFMYFYTDVDATGSGAYKFDLQQFYVDSWQGTMDKEKNIRLGRTDTDSVWLVNDSSKVDVTANIISDSSLQYLDRFTGLKGNIPDVPVIPAMPDSSNRGTRFWVGYGHHQFFTTTNTQSMVLYLSATQLSHVTVKINGTSWKKEYTVAARSVLVSDLIPRAGLSDARLLVEGLSDRGISIESDAPIVAYAHIYGSTSSGATMLLPVGTYGYEYYALMSRQYYSTNTYAWFYVVADNDNTVVEITPSVPTLGGRPAGVPFTVTLNKGEIYQVLGALKTGSEGYDLSGSKIRSISNSAGKCYPVGVFSGSSRTGIGCDGSAGGNGDNSIQQNFPSQAWGQHYLTAPTSTDDDPTVAMTNIFRVMVKDTSTAVFLNGVRLRGLINGRYYQYQSDIADYIEADKPITVAQFMASSLGTCPNTNGYGDPEMFYLSPIEQGVNTVGLYRNNVEVIVTNYLTLITPTAALSSILIDGVNTYDYSYDHPNKPGYTVVVKRWPAAKAQCIVTSDSAFTAITYGLGSAESYGYNAGTLVRNLNMKTSFNNTYDSSGTPSKYTCAKTPFRFTAMLPIIPKTLTWQLSKVSNLIPAADVTQTNPVPVDSLEANGKKYYKFTLSGDYMFTTPGMYYIPVLMGHPDIESCNNTAEVMLEIKVISAPVVDFSIDYSGCISDVAVLDGVVVTENNAAINVWKWNFADGTTGATQSVTKKYPAAGTYMEELHIITSEGCIGDTAKEVVVNDPGAATLVKDTITVCSGTDVTFNVQNPEAGVVYNWYNAATGGVLLGTGTSYTVPSVSSKGIYYVETLKAGCPGSSRTPAVLLVLPQLVAPVVTADSIGVNAIRFRWDAITGATGYEVSLDNGATWIEPSSGSLGLEHIVSGLRPVQSVTLIVKAKGCIDKISDPVTAVTLHDGIYIPNAFSPNGDGLNDVLQIYGAIIKEVHFMVFNQWGEKVFESNTQSLGWDGSFKSKGQPSGVYIYVCKLKLLDGTEIERKGSVNLIR
ncbi:gliding motility-associated C-terminal domain-containing protein [Chitinophaga sp. CF118]|uniref:Ig-like domain-containing protein n=1 Tax=Chitinophaga sp. CF118 TaxID=1884367 RepID=UPI0008F28322|nr:gliding motility-associated C-terminal domain-containing protein [Chitinophaga sp. CF118]SFE06455.1 gliding motility-associated C-terminal domain-containing protein [Chitinophaga sp. CF118]